MNIPVLITGTIIIVLFSWFVSVRHRRYHGISRFFSFESIFVLVVLNYKIWFRDPFSVLQLISWILLFFSLCLAVAGFVLLKTAGKPDSSFENTSRLVKKGLYKYIRHPLYLSLAIGGTGVVLKNPGFVQIILGIVNLLALFLTARIEEKEMVAKFGQEYRDYMDETKMFLPFLV